MWAACPSRPTCVLGPSWRGIDPARWARHVGEFLISARSAGVFAPYSPTHAPWLLAHKIQSPQEREALHALTVSLPRASGPFRHGGVPAVPACCPGASRLRGAGAPMPASIFLEGSPEPAVGEAGAGTMPSGLRGSGLARSGPRGQTSDKGAALVRPGALRHTRPVWGASCCCQT